MRRRLLIVAGVLVFLAISLLLARYLTTENRERSAIHDLITAQANGDAAAMLAQLEDCDAGCRAIVERIAGDLEREGEPKIINLQSETAYALGDATGTTRVAWTVPNQGLPVVQCVEVRREGNVLAGRRVTLLAISAPIGNEASC